MNFELIKDTEKVTRLKIQLFQIENNKKCFLSSTNSAVLLQE